MTGPGESDEPGDTVVGPPARPQEDVLADLARLHDRFHDEQVSFDDFESSKAALLAELQLG